ncbi:hypothetical protein [Bacillus wiedmannii]|uniref:hypothetical protein n=1 Tax=Bacillus wiedmannii TaxID=1890302 RepID=UPI0007DAE766|nr:hypothetical protein [Bacillus wiedmannii]OAK34633.1 hypothetical protein A6285_08880 [Bacillus wiedmannii]HDR7664533.1 hypothetical protein [Bacillus wiedmannii]
MNNNGYSSYPRPHVDLHCPFGPGSCHYDVHYPDPYGHGPGALVPISPWGGGMGGVHGPGPGGLLIPVTPPFGGGFGGGFGSGFGGGHFSHGHR